MRLQSCFLVTLSLTYGSNAVRYDALRHNQIMASQNLLPDGTPMYDEVELTANVRVGIDSFEDVKTEYVILPLDHWDANAGTYKNRFWASEQYYKPGGPVFIFDAGEGNAEGNVDFNDPSTMQVQMLKKFNGVGINWEHRYYGASTPTPINLTTPATAFEFLDTEQALADVPAFAWNFTRKSFPNIDLTPGSTPWIFVGGSYPGMRAAFVRHVYPETIYASYASSAPVQASIDMSFYFDPIWQGLNAYGYSNCSADIHAAIQEIDKKLDTADTAAAIKEKFLGPNSSKTRNGDFADTLALNIGNWQSYGARGPIGDFCNYISTDPVTKKTSGAEGFAASKGVEYTIDRWASWPTFIKDINKQYRSSCLGYQSSKSSSNATAAVSCDLKQGSRYNDPDMISWTWQYCTQWGFFQSANLGPHQIVSKHNSIVHQKEFCHEQFPDGLTSGFLPELPKANETNANYGGWNIRPSNTYWTGGQFDPWRTLSPLSDQSFSNQWKAVQEIPSCGKTDAVDESPIFGYLLKDSQHCYDFHTTLAYTAPARELFAQALTKWLGCFEKHGKGEVARYSGPSTLRRVSYPQIG
jgi:hypothetical protein